MLPTLEVGLGVPPVEAREEERGEEIEEDSDNSKTLGKCVCKY